LNTTQTLKESKLRAHS